MFETKNHRETENAHFVSSNFFSEIRAVYGIMWNNLALPDRPQTCVCVCVCLCVCVYIYIYIKYGACALYTGTETHSQYLMYIGPCIIVIVEE